jgi:hypothetical protein
LPVQFADRVRVVTATTGRGTMSLGAASSGFRTFATAVSDGALASGATVYYGIQDGINWENGSGIYTAGSPDTLTRTVASSSSGGTTLITLSGSAIVAIVLNQLSIATQALTDNSNNISTTAFVTGVVDGLISVSVAGGVNVTLTSLQASYSIIVLTGAITANINVIVPAVSDNYIFENTTSGAFTVTVKTSAGTGVIVGQGFNLLLFCDGTNVQRSGNDFSNVALTGGSINNMIIGATTATSANFTQINFGSNLGALILLFSTLYGIGISGLEFALWTGGNFAFRTSYPSGTAYALITPTGLNATAIGATTPSTGAFTTLSASGALSGTFSNYALLAGPTFTGIPAAPTAAVGTNTTQIATTAFVQSAANGLYTQSVAGNSNITLSATSAGNAILVFTGALTGSITISVPSGNAGGNWIVYNNTTGNYFITMITASGTGVIVGQGSRNQVYTDGTNMVYSLIAQANVSIQWTGGIVVANGTYYFTIFAPYSGTITGMDWFCVTGSFVANLQIGGVSVTGISAVTVSGSTVTDTGPTGGNIFYAGQTISVIVTSATSSPTNAILSLRINKS